MCGGGSAVSRSTPARSGTIPSRPGAISRPWACRCSRPSRSSRSWSRPMSGITARPDRLSASWPGFDPAISLRGAPAPRDPGSSLRYARDDRPAARSLRLHENVELELGVACVLGVVDELLDDGVRHDDALGLQIDL